MNETSEPTAEVLDAPAALQTDKIIDLSKKSLALADSYKGYAVATTQEYINGAEHLKDIMEQKKAVTAEEKEQLEPINESHRRTKRFFKRFFDRLDVAEQAVKSGLLAFKTEQDRIAEERARKERERAEKEAARLREEARKADEAAAKKERERLAELQRKADEVAEAERVRLAEEQRVADEAAEVERQRIAKLEAEAADDEAAKKIVAEEKRRAREKEEAEARRLQEQKDAAAKRAEDEQKRLHQETLDAEAAQRDRTARAETLEARADNKQAAPIASAAPKVRGVSTRTVWRFEITDISLIPDQYKDVNEKKIGGVVRALKADTDIPGVRAYPEQIMSAGRGRE